MTEVSGELTQGLDAASAEEIVELLRRANQDEMFLHMDNEALHAKLDQVAALLREDEGTVLVMSGCGTSGRFAYFERHAWADARNRVRYCISGGDRAFTVSVENAEDDADQGAKDLLEVCGDAARVVFIGISCGLSAPYVAGQLDLCLSQRDRFVGVVLLGFNEVDRARNIPIEGWRDGSHTFRHVAQRVAREGTVINPLLGPEPVTGSTRMKGGTATKFLLDCIRRRWVQLEGPSVAQLIQGFREASNAAYKDKQAIIAPIIDAGAKALQQKRSILYASNHPLAGMLGMIDASECPPTFGALRTDVMAFVFADGKVEGEDSFSPQAGDCVCIITVKEVSAADQSLLQQAQEAGATTFLLGPFADSFEGQIGLKLTLNAISTGAFVIYGKIYGNRMIDVRLSNNKLVHRAITIVQDVAHVSLEVAREAIWRAIYRQSKEQVHATVNENTPISQHVAAASRVDRVVPVAVLLAREVCTTVEEALSRIEKTPKLRDCFY